MQTWVAVFVVVTAVAFLLQTAILFGFYLLFRRTSAEITRLSGNFESRVFPLLNRVRSLLEESESDLHDMVHNVAEVTRTVHANSRRFDRLLEEAADRLRLQLVHADRLMSGALDTVEDSVQELQDALIEPVRTVTAFIRGVRAGVNFFRGRSHVAERRREAEDEGLFV